MAGSAFLQVFGALRGLVARELTAAEDLAVADRLLSDDLLAVAVGSRHAHTCGALLHWAATTLVGYVLWLLALVVHG